MKVTAGGWVLLSILVLLNVIALVSRIPEGLSRPKSKYKVTCGEPIVEWGSKDGGGLERVQVFPNPTMVEADYFKAVAKTDFSSEQCLEFYDGDVSWASKHRVVARLCGDCQSVEVVK